MLIKKLLILAVVVIAVEQIISFAFVKTKLPMFWGNEEVHVKLNYVMGHPEINTVFVGSSKVKTQIDPATFDGNTSGKTNSFNLGCNGLFIPESFNILNYLVDKTSVKYIFFDFRPVYHIYKENLHIPRTTYYHTAESYLNTMQNVFHANIPTTRKINAYSTFTIAATERLLNFNLAEGFINFKNFKEEEMQHSYDENRGCFFMGDGPGPELRHSHAELDKRAALSVSYMGQYKKDSLKNIPFNITYYSEMRKIIERATRKNKKIILLYPSALREFEYKEILPLLRELDTPEIIIADARDYPELYAVENNFETEHLNKKGSLIYSKILAEKFIRMFSY